MCWSEACVWQSFDSTVVIAKVSESEPESIFSRTGSQIQLNEVGMDIWYLCDGTNTLKDIVDHLAQKYKDTKEARKAAEEAVSTLKELEFITYEETPKECEPIEISPEHYLVWDDNVYWNELEGRVVAMHNLTGTTFTFSDTTSKAWKLCDGKNPVADILSLLKEKGMVNQESPSEEFILLFKQFIKLGMLSLLDNPAD